MKFSKGQVSAYDHDDYADYDPEEDTDYRMEREGFHIVESRIELTDSAGRNKTIVKRDSDHRPKNILE